MEDGVVNRSWRAYEIPVHLYNPRQTIVFVTEFTVVGIVVQFRDSKGGNDSRREPWKYVGDLARKWI